MNTIDMPTGRFDLSGKKFGMIRVVKYFSRKKYGEIIWKCVCDCGKKCNLIQRSLTNRKNPNCGCVGVRKNIESPYWKGCGELSHELYNLSRRNAKIKGFKFTVSIKYLWNLFLKQKKKCAFTGIPLYFNPTSKELKNRTASLDRIDSRNGYVKGNLQWVHRIVNRLKKNIDDDQFIKICHLVSRKCLEPNIDLTSDYYSRKKGNALKKEIQ